MNTKTELIQSDEIGTFDTPKKINRSGKSIPSLIIDQLEGGKFTFEMVQDLKKQFPIFTYRTCLTIHGDWGNIQTERIGAYKNIRQNENGSLEVIWSAIDVDKVKAIAKGLYAVNCRNWGYKENSTSRSFVASKRITPETYAECKQWAIDWVNRLNKLPIYGKAFAQVFSVFGLHMVEVSLCIYSLPETSVNNVLLTLCQMDQEQYDKALSEVKAQREQETQERETERLQREQKAQEQAEARKKLSEPFAAQIAHLQTVKAPDGNMAVRVAINEAGSPCFIWYREGKKGSFGRTQYERAQTAELVAPDKWELFKKQMKRDEFISYTSKFTLKQVQTVNPEPKPEPKQENTQHLARVGDIEVVEYSEKAIAVFGDTKPIKDILKETGGRFNPFLTHHGNKRAGWVFPKSKQMEIELIIKPK